jgi:hypothetical protein
VTRRIVNAPGTYDRRCGLSTARRFNGRFFGPRVGLIAFVTFFTGARPARAEPPSPAITATTDPKPVTPAPVLVMGEAKSQAQGNPMQTSTALPPPLPPPALASPPSPPPAGPALVALRPGPPTEPFVTRRRVAFVAASVALAGAGAGAVFGALALQNKSDYDKKRTYANSDRGNNDAAYADGGIALAVAAGITSLVLFVTSDTSDAAVSAAAARKHSPSFSASPFVIAHGGGAGALVRF